MNYRDLGPGHDEDYEPDALTPTSQPARDEDDADPFRFEVVDESRTPKGWAGPAAIAALLAIAVGAGWSMTHRGTDHGQHPAASSSIEAATSTSTSPPATTSSSTSPPAATSTTPAGAAPQEAALTFLRVWGQRSITAGEWEQQIKPLCDERGWFLMQGTDPQNVPEFKVEGSPMVTPGGGNVTISVSVRTTIGSSLLTFVRNKDTGQLLMHNFVVPGGTVS